MRKQNQARLSAIQPKIAAAPPKQPVAPTVYRPQPIPKVLQRTAATIKQPLTVNAKPAAPPVYRPQPIQRVMQGKLSPSSSQTEPNRKQPPAPLTCRPQPTTISAKMSDKQAGARPHHPKPVAGTQVSKPGAIQRFPLHKLDENAYGTNKSRFAARYRQRALNTTVDTDRHLAKVMPTSNIATFKLVRRDKWKSVNQDVGQGASLKDAKKKFLNKTDDIQFVTLPSNPQMAHSWNTGTSNQIVKKSNKGHSEMLIFEHLSSSLKQQGYNWPEDWAIEWVYTERAPCTSAGKYRSGYDEGCSSTIMSLEEIQQEGIKVYFSFLGKKESANVSVKTRLQNQMKKYANANTNPVLISKDQMINNMRDEVIVGRIARSVNAMPLHLKALAVDVQKGYERCLGYARNQQPPNPMLLKRIEAYGTWLKLYEWSQNPPYQMQDGKKQYQHDVLEMYKAAEDFLADNARRLGSSGSLDGFITQASKFMT